MKKIEIIELIEKKKKLDNIKCTLKKFEKIKPYGIKWYFPDCENLKEEFNILKKELIEAEDNLEKLRIEVSQNCEHQIRLHYCGHHPEYNRCVFCDKIIYVKDDNSERYISFYSAIQDGEEDYEEEIYIGKLHLINPYHDYDIINIIEYILKDKNDYDDIELINELNKLDLPYKKIHNNLYLSLKK